MFVLNAEEIKKEVNENQLISDFINEDTQLTPNGFDLTVKEVHDLNGSADIDFSNKERKLPSFSALTPEKKNPDDSHGWWFLKKGVYKIKMNESFKMPLNLIAFAKPRSSLLRSGVTVSTGFWDAGFEGKVEFLLSVLNEEGVRIKENARLVQLVFLKMNETEKGYEGVHKHLK